MTATELLGNLFVRLGVLPVAAVFLTGLVRRQSTRVGQPRSPVFSRDTFNVGLDLMVLAALTAFTALIDRARSQAILDGQVRQARGADLDRLQAQVVELQDGQLWSALMLAMAIVGSFLLAGYQSDHGYEKLPSPTRGSRAGVVPPKISRRAVLVGLFWGLVTLSLVLVTSG